MVHGVAGNELRQWIAG